MSSESFNTRQRRSLITDIFLHKTLRVYNGVTLRSFFVRSEMLGHRLGEFSITKVLGDDILLSKSVKMKARRKRR